MKNQNSIKVKPVNVCCIKCDHWLPKILTEKTREGYICEECLNEK